MSFLDGIKIDRVPAASQGDVAELVRNSFYKMFHAQLTGLFATAHSPDPRTQPPFRFCLIYKYPKMEHSCGH
jgi:hypothetical protein